MIQQKMIFGFLLISFVVGETIEHVGQGQGLNDTQCDECATFIWGELVFL